MSVTCINQLVDVVIGAVMAFLDLLELAELLKVGNRLLSLKIRSFDFFN